ncbi:hypothetical protein LTR84_011048 [Exophiala bonariae]|uniref:Extracellular serine-rich protein n=1 Tax=Exophiala bonariae TaxID=1690606 RepID=A0AAV9NMF6_9EURO|nr:hypothetical protein LTR84_011048 [Exophiala bonariae]
MTLLEVLSRLLAVLTATATTSAQSTSTTSSVIAVTTTPAALTTSFISTSSFITSTSSTSLTPSTTTTTSSSTASAVPSLINSTVQGKILVIARDAASASSASSGFNGYGIPFDALLVPQSGTSLPQLTDTTGGLYGGIVVVSQVSYDYGTAGFQSALTSEQWTQLYNYQITYGVRMVQLDVYPGPAFGATALGGCCNAGVEQLISFSNTSAFSQAGLKMGAGVSTLGLYHYPAQISNASTTFEVAQFAAAAGFQKSTAAVINNFSGRQQMVFFISFATDWSPTSNFLQHAYITWITRGLYAGYRRVNLNTQIDDMFLSTGIYSPSGTEYRVTTSDVKSIADWVPKIQAKMNQGSSYLPEIGHNGNGNIEYAGQVSTASATRCAPGAIDTEERNDTALEFQKPLGTGTDAWPLTPTKYGYSVLCDNYDPLKVWFSTNSNRDKFTHISHTFTHYELNNATYADALKEIQFNQAWMDQIGLNKGKFSSDGLIPPAITGLHNGDVLRAWKDAGLTHCVGDNTRVPLRNPKNTMYGLTTDVASNGYAGFLVIPRWATRIYYNCDTPACTTQEWIDTSAGAGTFADLLAVEKSDTMRHLFGLYREGYMFHQANLRTTGVAAIVINGVSANISIFQAWVETVVQEFARLVNWPMISLKQSDLATAFKAREARDKCGYGISWAVNNGKITQVTVKASGNSCASQIPLTVPASVSNVQSSTQEKIGNDPLTLWVTLAGAAKTFTLSTALAV